MMQPQLSPAHGPDAQDAGARPAQAVPTPGARCPRCREPLAIIRLEGRRSRGVAARLCPSLTCGCKLIVPM